MWRRVNDDDGQDRCEEWVNDDDDGQDECDNDQDELWWGARVLLSWLQVAHEWYWQSFHNALFGSQ